MSRLSSGGVSRGNLQARWSKSRKQARQQVVGVSRACSEDQRPNLSRAASNSLQCCMAVLHLQRAALRDAIDSGIGLSITIDKLRMFVNKTLSILNAYQ